MERFGTTRAGADVHRLVLEDGGLRVALLTLGSILQDVRLDGVDRPLTAGSTDLALYDGGPMRYFGAIVGPVANRIGAARCVFDLQTLVFEPNGAGGHHLHGGSAGLHARVWTVADHGPSHAVLETEAAAGVGGLPGNRHWRAEWRVEGLALTLTLDARTDAPTLMNCANHSYWTLGADVDGTMLRIDADSYLSCDDTVLPTGEVAPVAGTRYDLRRARALGPQDVLDTNFCLGTARGPLRPVLRLEGGGLALDVDTTEPGMQIYTADGFAGAEGHAAYGPRFGVAIEAQFWPDAPNRPAFPSVRLDPGESWRQVTRWRLTRV